MIRTAVVPAAGFGTRMQPLSLAVPKELFPFGRLALIEWTLQELAASGIERIAVVIRPGKTLIQEYILSRQQHFAGVRFFFPIQTRPLGLGDALCAASEVISNEPFVMAIPDQVLLSDQPGTAQLIAASRAAEGVWHSQVRLKSDELGYFVGAKTYATHPASPARITGLGDSHPENLHGFGRTLFLPEVLSYMGQDYINPANGEVDFSKTYAALLKQMPLYVTTLAGQACDLGSWPGYYHYLKHVMSTS